MGLKIVYCLHSSGNEYLQNYLSVAPGGANKGQRAMESKQNPEEQHRMEALLMRHTFELLLIKTRARIHEKSKCKELLLVTQF